jgi:hypothetical protein
VASFQHEVKPDGSTQNEAREEKDGKDCAPADARNTPRTSRYDDEARILTVV